MGERAQPRLFFAIRCAASPGLRRALRELADLGGRQIKTVAPDDLHLTLRFLGPTPADRVDALARALDAAAKGGPGPFDVRWVAAGRYPEDTRKPARVVYASPADPEPFAQLAATLTAQLAALDPPIEPDDRPFAAHLTLARLKGPRRSARPGRSAPSAGPAIDRWCRAHAHCDLGGCRVERAQLIASELTPDGPIHRVQHEASL